MDRRQFLTRSAAALAVAAVAPPVAAKAADWMPGDTIFPTSTGPVWRCIKAGNPGVWLSVYDDNGPLTGSPR
jgi:hypothetical protein